MHDDIVDEPMSQEKGGVGKKQFLILNYKRILSRTQREMYLWLMKVTRLVM